MARALTQLDLWIKRHAEPLDCDRDLHLTYGPWRFLFAFMRDGAARSLTYRVETDPRWRSVDLRALRPPSSDLLALAGQDLFQVRRRIADFWALGARMRWLHDQLAALHEANRLPDTEVAVRVQWHYYTQDDEW